MDLPLAILFGFLFGFIGSMPVAGPIAALVLARAIQGRPKAGISISAGAAIAESVYAALTFWGLATLIGRYPIIVPVSRCLAAVALITLGVVLLRARPPTPKADCPKEGWRGSFLLGFSITALNPTLVATWTAASATLAATGWLALTPALAAPFALAACAGIVLWFLLLVRIVGRYQDRFRPETLRRVLQGTGVALLALGAWFALGLARYIWS
ncbi:MAG: LysE family transporter [Polyangia bacterium]|jgi:threonine/homoserine/homoserine lactone efflux protein|nr:LysE family transporter [Polyangia bacterium]